MSDDWCDPIPTPTPAGPLPLAPRTGQPAIDFGYARVGPNAMPASGYCLQFVRENFAVPAVYGSAIDAWHGAAYRHPGDPNPPAGVPVWYDTASVYGHVAFYVGGGRCLSTYNADVRDLAFADMPNVFGGPYLGWAPEVNEHQIILAPTPTPEPPPIPEVNDLMPWFFRRNDGAIIVVGPTGARTCTAVQWDVYNNLGQAIFPPGMSAMDPGPFDEVLTSLGGLQP